MNRRTYLATVGAGLASLAGGTALARSHRADVLVEPSMVRARGDPVSTTGTVRRDSVEYLEETDEVRYATMYRTDGTAVYETEPFEKWARRECVSVGSETVVATIENRFDRPIEGVGKGVRGLFFGLLITVDYIVERDRDGAVTSEPTVDYDELVSVTPRSVTTTVSLGGREHTRAVPVAVEYVETQPIRGDWNLSSA